MRLTKLNKRKAPWIVGFAIAAMIGSTAAVHLQAESNPPRVSAAVANANSLSEAFRETARVVAPSVVTITSETEVAGPTAPRQGQPMDDEMMKRFFGEGTPFGEMFKGQPEMHRFFKPSAESTTRTGIGSGVVIDASGLILTNNHVVADATNVMVKLADGREFKASEVKTDPKTDLAVLKIDGATDLVAARMGDSDRMEIGDWVLALGQPFGLEGTVTAGIISAKSRGIGITARENFLQTDAAINPGNSGGPLVNLAGEVIGINTAISSRSGGNNGVGFAIPIDEAKWVSDQLIKDGVVRRAMLGVGIQKVSHDLASTFGVQSNHGVLVTEVVPGSPAEKAGLKQGDVILSFSGREVHDPRGLQNVVEQSDPGAKQSIEIMRDGKPLTIEAVCEVQPEAGLAHSGQTAEVSKVESLGMEVGNLTEDLAKKLGVKDIAGVVITNVNPGSAADRAGLQEGNVITQVERKSVASVDQFEALTKDHDLSNPLLLLVKTDQGSRYVILKSGT
ncbi:putative periplasmic serine endoprotease DegP-like precursor [Rosistilla carotiformis]|uniref:Putative periplasmic serine endoprotease DegP-like n=1 Tax=Rosistilla carotiformis TaxID=2528017 RepID=A0A518JSV7_9BACT|nr:Do family serine endopeptidase [Rosistilla carotiformis]QDV68620.1 putative periplasmic serine endoprotease DegP-like precursor [Rosistilla carotiformis]